ncbi:caspase family protein [Stagnihabitans tardus]|uniref:Peptidase C14, caspase catalytic subunit p20 n=1 Tax=Stagnihabitans tardus TaxID=2699202 RepID=A0AAE4YCP7_9RHOB|nr:caspase family protein [Stagnihabitans tardus]NBZ88808.1 peptidase C14, caspase catalytic subunit p20 [Stagnihabitans tardus]
MRLLASFLMFLALAVPAMAEKIAMVIGMAAYESVPGLKNTINDAKRVGAKLEQVGFKVTYVLDATQQQLLDTMDSFSFASETADVALVYYAGHGVEASGQNFLIPVDAKVRSIKDVARVSVSLDQMLAAVDHARKMRIVILDACRNNPFGELLSASDIGEGGVAEQGLAPVNPEQGTLVAFAQQKNKVALDGAGDNSPYALALTESITEPDLEIGLMFRRVRDEVLKATDNKQEPWTNGSLSGTPFYLAGSSDGVADPEAAADPRVAWAGIKPDAEQRMRSLAEEGDPRSMLGLAYIAQNPNDSRYDPKLALDYMTRAAAAGEAEAEFELAKIYEQGLGVPPDPKRALELYQAAADQGFADALNDLGFLYFQGGLGLVPDQAKGIEYFQKAAALRHPEAMFNMAGMIDGGFLRDKGPKDAAAYLYDSLRAGSADVLNQLTTNAEAFSPKTRVELQKILKEHNFLEGKADGKFGPGAIAAIRLAYGLKD